MRKNPAGRWGQGHRTISQPAPAALWHWRWSTPPPTPGDSHALPPRRGQPAIPSSGRGTPAPAFLQPLPARGTLKRAARRPHSAPALHSTLKGHLLTTRTCRGRRGSRGAPGTTGPRGDRAMTPGAAFCRAAVARAPGSAGLPSALPTSQPRVPSRTLERLGLSFPTCATGAKPPPGGTPDPKRN